MKRIFFLALFFVCAIGLSQSTKTRAILFDTITSTERNAMTIENSRVGLIYNESTGQFEANPKNTGWVSFSSLLSITESQISDLGDYVDKTSNDNIGGEKTFTNADTNFDGRINLEPIGSASFESGYGNISLNASSNLRVVGSGLTNRYIIDADNITAERTFTLPNTSGTLALTSDLGGSVPSDSGSSDGDVLTTDGAGTYTWETPTGGGSSLPVDDTTSLVQDPVDGTKEMRIDVGAVSTATVRTLTMPDADVNLGDMVSSTSVLTDNFISMGDGSRGMESSNMYADGFGRLSVPLGVYQGVIEGVSGRRWNTGVNSGTYRFSYQNTSETSLNVGTYSVLYTLNNTGTPSAATDLIDKAYADANYGGGTDDQTASEVNITDAGGNYTGTTVEAALTEVADSLAVKVNVHPDSGQSSIRLGLGDETEKDAATLTATDLYFCSDCDVAVTDTGTTIDLNGFVQIDDSAVDTATFTLNDIRAGGYAEILINEATEPAITGATQLPGTTAFAAATPMLLCVKAFGSSVYYFFVELP